MGYPVDTQNNWEQGFWKSSNPIKTMNNAIQLFVQNYPYADGKYRRNFAVNVIQNQIIGKKVPMRKLLELLEYEIKKIDVTKSIIKNRNNPIKKSTSKISVFQADRLDGNTFQDFVAELLKKNGYTDVDVTGKSGDQGGDILASKDDKQYVIQAKRYALDHKVSNSAVQEAYGAIPHYNANVGAVITNSFYTNGAKELAKTTGIILWNRQDLMKFIEKYNKDNN